MKIKHTDFGIAYANGDFNNGIIEMNKLLLKYPKLYKLILKHEMEHIKNPSFFDTLRIDFMDMFDFKKQLQLNKLPFTMRLQAVLPIWFYKGQVSGNITLIVFDLLLLLIIGIIVII